MIRIALIGAGGIALSHADAIHDNPDCALCAVADINRARAEEIALRHGAKAYTDYKEIDCGTVDAAIITLPHFLHCEASVYFLERGVHVLCEKPMANTLAECDRMIEAARRTGKHLAIGHVQKYYSALQKIREIIESKRFGKLVMINDVRCKDYVTNRPAWFLKKETAGGGIAMNLGAHSIDRILYTTALSIESAAGNAQNFVSEHDVETSAHMLLRLTGGVSATVTLCGAHVPPEHETTYYFTDGAVKMKGDALYIYEDGEYKCYGGEHMLISAQLCEFLKLLRGEKSEICSPEYGREIIRILKEII